MFMEFIIQNKRAEKRIKFPCDEDQYQLICKDLKLTDNRVFIKSVTWLKDFSFLEGKIVDFDEVNYGLLFRNEDVAFEEVYKGKGFPSYYYTGGEVLGVAIEKDGEKDYIYFPCEKTEIERALKRIGAGDISECNKNIDFCGGDEEWEDYFNDLLQKNDIESVNAISSDINCLGANLDAISKNLYKLSAVMEFAGVTTADTEKVIRLAECLDEFEFYREIGNDYNLGTKLIENEIGSAAEKIGDYIDYEKYAQDFLEENGGAYTKYGDAVYLRDDQSLSEILGENEIKMGGI